MPLSDDPWIAEHSMIDPERLHALGSITLWWNHCERNLLFIFSAVAGFSRGMGWILAHDLGAIAISSRIRELMTRLDIRDDIQSVLNNYLTNYDICRQNRNVLTHFTAHVPKDIDFDTVDLKSVQFVRVKSLFATADFFPSTLSDIRRVAAEIRGLALHSWSIYEALESLAADKPSELPPPIVAPELLVTPRQNNSRKPTRQPKLSRAERRKRAHREPKS
jgi:hypothetical protein